MRLAAPILAATVLAALSILAPTHATILVHLEVPDLIAHADRGVVVGRVVATRSDWGPGRAMIFTETTLLVAEDLTARHAPGSVMTFRMPGGRVDGIAVEVAGTPRFAVGSEIVVFASTWSDGALSVVGHEQGLSRLTRSTDGTSRLEGGRAAGMELSELRSLVAARRASGNDAGEIHGDAAEAPALDAPMFVTGGVSADGAYAIFSADYEGQGMTVTPHGSGDGDLCTAEAFAFSTPDPYIYIAAWSDDAVAQGLVHDLAFDGHTVPGGSAGWEVCPTGVDRDSYPPPTPADMAAAVRQCGTSDSWTTPAAGGMNGTFNTSHWCGGPVAGVSTSARWTWHDSGACPGPLAPFEPGCDHDEWLIFRRCRPTRVHGEVTADGSYGVYTADGEGPASTITLRGVGNGTDGICSPESFDFTTSDRYLYLVAYSDDFGAQGLLHDLWVDDIPAWSDMSDWEVCPSKFDLDGGPPPTPAQLATTIGNCNLADAWRTSTRGGYNGLFNTDTWCGGIIDGIDTVARWVWHDSTNCPGPLAPFEPGCDHDEYLIFRRELGCRELGWSWDWYEGEPRRRIYPQDLPEPVWIDPRGIASINDADHGVLAAEYAVDLWEEAGVGDLLIPVRGSPDDPDGVPPFVVGDGLSVIRFDPQPGVCETFCLGSAGNTLLDEEMTDTCDGATYWRRLDTDIVVNGSDFQFTSLGELALEGDCTVLTNPSPFSLGEWYIEHVVAHEVGHHLGLGHPPGDIAMMGFARPCDERKTRLPLDDLVGLREGYACPFTHEGTPVDSDLDGFGQDLDCDDRSAAVFPGAPETCDLLDNDCDGLDDFAEGLDCADACWVAAGGPAELRAERGACSAARVPGYRNVFVRGVLSPAPVSGVPVDAIGCPEPYVYDRVAETTDLSAGSAWFYLVRDAAASDFGTDSAGTPRVPIEQPCP